MAAPATKFKKLFEPGRIGGMTLKNRIVKPAMGTNFGGEDGSVTQYMTDYYAEIAKGGAAMVIIEISCVDSRLGRGYHRQICVDDDKFIPGLSKLARGIKQHGAKAVIQLHHAGREAKFRVTGNQPVSSSAVAAPWTEMPREMTISEIHDVVASFARAAGIAKRSGFDGVEIHGAHGYLLAQFLTPLVNKRKDEYGGSLENRARILMEIIRAIRQAVGPDYPLLCRINGSEFGMEGSYTHAEAQQVARMCQENGVNAIDVSGFGYGRQALVTFPELPRGQLNQLGRGIKQVVDIPVIAVGRIDAESGEEILETGGADYVAMGRALLCDPELPNKVQSGRLDDVRPCIACLQCISHMMLRDVELRCTVNATIGGGEEYKLRPAERSKRVCIVGGGPAGMEAARVAAERGHKVVLYDKGSKLGGQILAAIRPPRKSRIEPFLDYLDNQVRKLSLQVEPEKEITPKFIQEISPDVVIVSTGVLPIIHTITGLNKFNAVLPEDVLFERVETGDRVVILGGGAVGCETADYLAEKGKKVTVLEL